MLRTLFIAVFLSVYILLVGPPLLVYTLITNNPEPIYWAGVKGVMFFVRAVGVKVKVKGIERIPPGVCLFAATIPAPRTHRQWWARFREELRSC